MGIAFLASAKTAAAATYRTTDANTGATADANDHGRATADAGAVGQRVNPRAWHDVGAGRDVRQTCL